MVKEAKNFDENIAEPDAAVEVIGKDDELLELDEGHKSIKNN